MKSIDFPEANFPLAKDQPQYKTLFVFKLGPPNFEMTMCFELTEKEISEIVATKKLWFTQVTFGRGFSPIRMSTSNPFQTIVITNRIPMDENRTPAEEWDKTHYSGTVGHIAPGRELETTGPCSNCGKEEQQHFWSSRQCEL